MTKSFQYPPIHSKLPNTMVSIFSQMSALAEKYQALNLSQGFPNYPVSPELIALVNAYMEKGYNQYAPMAGMMPLRERIAQKIEAMYGLDVHPESEITITAGATQGIFTTIAALIRPGDEVIIFEPAYDSYRPSVELFGGKVIPIRLLAPDFNIDWAYVRSAMTEKTRLIIINNPNNPSTKMLCREDLLQLELLLKDSDAFLLSDEVYEHIVFDDRVHETVLSYPRLRERSYVVASFGKLLHTTGWKLGYVIAPPILTGEFRKVHQFNVFSANTPMQLAIADYLKDSNSYLELAAFFQEKRDFLTSGLQGSRLEVVDSESTYFLLVNYSAVSNLSELDFAKHLTEHYAVATIPVSTFYSAPCEQNLLRICFAKDHITLAKAVDLLHKIV
ncbi:methionine aminotransferase [Sphingobacterium deserti]|uniref:Kynurenine--oxoglutarate transaminase n=1 Tax=Sphingobacterium deserti TaxID=1229276 RepID=A0A0B8T846_9SPHI|nr:methionine aminotransferase [Sphingobacterium deserti]KGE14784.1 Kynurenine--oxoglutarate transaminase [Sphingobacterium deserti]